MNIDNKLDIYKNHISDSKVAKKNINATIDQSLVASTEEKNIKMELEEKNSDSYKKSKNKKKKKSDSSLNELELLNSQKNNKITNNPLKLLQII